MKHTRKKVDLFKGCKVCCQTASVVCKEVFQIQGGKVCCKAPIWGFPLTFQNFDLCLIDFEEH